MLTSSFYKSLIQPQHFYNLLIQYSYAKMGNCVLMFQIGKQLTQGQKWQIMVDAHPDQRFKLFMDDRYKRLRGLLDQIPNDLFIKAMDVACTSIFLKDRQPSSNYKKFFVNWAQTYEAICDDIFYPSEVPVRQKKQIDAISDFVRKGVQEGKRIRGCGTRHSWGNIFGDHQQRLVAFYPQKVAKGTAKQIQAWAMQMEELELSMLKDNIEHLNLIRKVGEYEYEVKQKMIKKHLVKIGAGVSNEQLRRWCIKNGFQYKSNVIMVEINVCGALGTCSHGSGIDSQTLADYVHEIEFIDSNGKRQKISKKENPKLIKSAASALGLLGLVIFVTMELDELQIVKLEPRKQYKDFVVPWPKDYPQDKIKKRIKRQGYQNQLELSSGFETNWEKNFIKFKKAVNKTYNEWFYFPVEGQNVFENAWETIGKKTIEKVQSINRDTEGVFVEEYPLPAMKYFSEFALLAGNLFANSTPTQSTISIIMRNPFLFFPSENVYINYPDAVHFQRGIHNLKVRNFECQIQVPGVGEPDYNLIQWLWWDSFELVEKNQDIINVALEMRIFKGSDATLAPEHQMDFVCSIQIIRTLNLNQKEQKVWADFVSQIFSIWKKRIEGKVNSKGKPLNILPHWGKQWDFHPEVKAHVMKSQQMKSSVGKFLRDYKQIASIKGFDYQKNLQTFSNKVYRQLLSIAAQNPEDIIY